MRRAEWVGVFEKVGSVPVQAALALPLAFAVGAALAKWVPPASLERAVSVQSFALLCTLSSLVGLLSALGRGAWPRFFFSLLVLVSVAWGISNARTRFLGRLDLGVGEGSVAYRDVQAGPSARPPELPLEVATVRGAPSPGCELQMTKGAIHLPLGGVTRVGGARLTLESVRPAPLFFLVEPDGSRSMEGFLKVGDDVSGGAFQFGLMPHRFYLRAVTAGEGVGVIPPERLHLTVVRGKLILVDREVKAGELVTVDGFEASFDPGAGWVTLRVELIPPLWPAWVTAVLLLLSAGAGFSALRKAPCTS